ncbi:MFS transporter [Agromyces seonyuensis]|uniref:MFS transporter n=1 Tax=Agromyces seonyuensis TaxID=2662446 RepID=A0A6I4NVJ8_9MICO|nr:MFS transporter [Agromyces seonyuensis]MWB98408.1 hypothetical protein [Agromyces seonyuensis]
MPNSNPAAPAEAPEPPLTTVLDERDDVRDAAKLPPAFSLRFSTRGVSLALNVIVVMQLTFYATDIVGLPAALVGGLFLAAKLFDGLTDLAVGFVIDRTNSRWGRARPYELFIIPLWVLTVAIFSTPEMSTFWQATYLFVLYVLIQSVCATFLNGSEALYLKRALQGEERYAKLLSRQGVIIMIVAAVGSVMLPQLMASWGTQPGGWTLIAAVYAVPMMVVGLIRFFTVKELSPEELGDARSPRVSVMPAVRAVLRNRFVLILSVIVLLANIVINMNTIVGAYYFKWILGDLGLLSLIAAAGAVIPFLFLLFPLAVRTIGAINFVRIGLVLAIVGFGLVFLFPQNLALVVGGQILGSFTTIITMLVGYFVIQTMTYSEWKSGLRVDAVTNSVVSFSSKVGSGLASALVGIVMGIVGYNGLAEAQTEAASSTIVSLYSIVPLALAATMLVLTFFYKLDKVVARLRDDLSEGVHADTSSISI